MNDWESADNAQENADICLESVDNDLVNGDNEEGKCEKLEINGDSLHWNARGNVVENGGHHGGDDHYCEGEGDNGLNFQGDGGGYCDVDYQHCDGDDYHGVDGG